MDYAIAVVTLWSALRSAVIAPAAGAAGWVVAKELGRLGPGGRRWLWGLLIGAILAPDLVAGYGYRNFSLSLARHPAWNEAFLTLVIGLKAAAVAAVVARFTPEPALTPAGRHVLRLAGGRVPRIDRWRIVGRGALERAWPAVAVAFLFAFQQFELPSLTGATAWTVTLFDRQAMLPDLAESADPLVWPVAVELLALGPVVALVLRGVAANRRVVLPAGRSWWASVAAWVIAGGAFLLTAGVPLGALVVEGTPGLGFVAARTPAALDYWREAGTALGFGVGAGVAAYVIAVALLRLAARWRVAGVVLLVVACVPGLCGTLVPSLAAVEWLQTPVLLPLRDTLVPLVVVLALYLLPRAVLLEGLSRLVRDASAVHLARTLRASPVAGQRGAGRRLLWELEGFGRYCRVALLAYWGYLDLTAAVMLAPPAVVPVTARLYNLMHYGRNASLSAMALVTVAVPLVAFAAVLLVRRVSLRVLRR